MTSYDGSHRTQNKKRKSNYEKSKIQFKPTAGVLILLLLACFAAVFISAPNPASARDQVPFNGTLAGCVETQEPVDQCTIHSHAALFGNATHLGAFNGTGEFYQNFCEDPPNITYIGSFHLFAANGDELSGTFEGYLSPTETPGVYDNHETSDVTGGTGRFAGATGHWESGGQIDLTTEPLCFGFPRARVDLKCRLDEAVGMVRLFCASQLAFVWLRCARSPKRLATFLDSASRLASPEQNSRQCHWSNLFSTY